MNRCARNCYSCPVCIAPLSVQSLEQSPASLNPDSGSQPIGPFFLSCQYCNWTSLDISIEFEKANNITGQLTTLKNKQKGYMNEEESSNSAERQENEGLLKKGNSKPEQYQESSALARVAEDEETFNNLLNFFKSQQFSQSVHGGDIGFDSPSSLTRIMNLYTNAGAKRMRREKPRAIREALKPKEGFQELNLSSEDCIIDRLATTQWEDLASVEQRRQQIGLSEARFVDDLRPIPTLLRTKRLKRCRACRNVLFRPEAKIQSARPKIRLLAMAYVPRVSIIPFPSALQGPAKSVSFDPNGLIPQIPIQFLITLHNPLYDPMLITLATPSVTPGKVSNRVTILCPQFEVGASTDVWDEALNAPGSDSRTSESTILTMRERNKAGNSTASSNTGVAAEAGKIWERGRNWTSIVVEVVPGSHPAYTEQNNSSNSAPNDTSVKADHGEEIEEERLSDDDFVLEIPIFVRYEYETDPAEEGGSSSRPLQVSSSISVSSKEVLGGTKGRSNKRAKEKRDGAFWTVLGVGKISV